MRPGPWGHHRRAAHRDRRASPRAAGAATSDVAHRGLEGLRRRPGALAGLRAGARGEGLDISFQDNIGPTEIVYPALENGDLDGYADYQGTLLTYLGGQPTGDSAETYTALQDEARRHRDRREQARAGGRRQRLLRHEGDREEAQAEDDVRPRRGLRPSSPSAARPSARSGRCASATTSQQLYGFEFSEVKKLDTGGPITVQALEDGDIDVALLFTGQQRHPEGRGAADRRPGPPARRQPGVPDPRGQGDAGGAQGRERGVGEADHAPRTTRCRSRSARTRKTRPTRPPPSWRPASSPRCRVTPLRRPALRARLRRS